MSSLLSVWQVEKAENLRIAFNKTYFIWPAIKITKPDNCMWLIWHSMIRKGTVKPCSWCLFITASVWLISVERSGLDCLPRHQFSRPPTAPQVYRVHLKVMFSTLVFSGHKTKWWEGKGREWREMCGVEGRECHLNPTYISVESHSCSDTYTLWSTNPPPQIWLRSPMTIPLIKTENITLQQHEHARTHIAHIDRNAHTSI